MKMQLPFAKVKKLYGKRTWKPVGPAYPSEPIPPFFGEGVVGEVAEAEVALEDDVVAGSDDPDAARPEEMDPEETDTDNNGGDTGEDDFWEDDDPDNPYPPRRKVADVMTEGDIRALMDRGEADPDVVVALMKQGVIPEKLAHDYLDTRPVLDVAEEASPVKVVPSETTRGEESGSRTSRGKVKCCLSE